MRLLASSTPTSSSSSLRRTRKARLVSVVVPDLEMTLIEKRLPLHSAMMSFRAVGLMLLPQK